MRTAHATPQAKQIVAALVAARKAARAAGQDSALVDATPLGRPAADVAAIGIFTGCITQVAPDDQHVVVYA